MSQALLDQVKAHVRAAFTPKEVRQVLAYGGEFSGAELGKVGYSCPAIFITVLGWVPKPNGDRLRGRNVRAVSMAAFIAFAHVDREQRMAGAMALADRLSLLLSGWAPAVGNAPFDVMPVDEDPTCENLYGRAVDAAGQALWLVRWTQDVRALRPAPELFDLLRVDITENVLPGVTGGAPDPEPAALEVTDQINFQRP